VRAATRLAPTLSGWSTSTMARRNRVTELWGELQARLPTATARVFAATLVEILSIHTAVSYFATWLAMEPERKDSESRDALRALRKMAALEEETPAVAATVPEMQLLMTSATQPLRSLIFTLWVTACRYGDLESAIVAQEWPTESPTEIILLLRFLRSKSDQFGERKLTKYLRLYNEEAAWVRRALTESIPYAEALRMLKRHCPGLSMHSFRRGAVSHLIATGSWEREVVTLTCHADGPKSVSRYIAPTPLSEAAMTQQRLSARLAAVLRTPGSL
jgi:hypothetical protein